MGLAIVPVRVTIRPGALSAIDDGNPIITGSVGKPIDPARERRPVVASREKYRVYIRRRINSGRCRQCGACRGCGRRRRRPRVCLCWIPPKYTQRCERCQRREHRRWRAAYPDGNFATIKRRTPQQCRERSRLETFLRQLGSTAPASSLAT